MKKTPCLGASVANYFLRNTDAQTTNQYPEIVAEMEARLKEIVN